MRDAISVSRVALLHPAIRDEVKNLIEAAEQNLPDNITIRIVQGLRTIDEQNALYAQGRTKPGNIVTKAKGGSSFHNYGTAIDFCLLIDGKVSWIVDALWMIVVNVFKAAGYEWGGGWKTLKDYPHLQKTFGLGWKEMLKRYNAKDFIVNTEYIRL